MPELVHEFTYTADLEPPVTVGTGPYGTRFIFSATGGTIEGDRIKGTVAPGTVDWLLLSTASTGSPDRRLAWS